MPTDLGNWIVEELKKRGWSQNELGRRAGLTSATISNVVTGSRNPNFDTIVAIAGALRVPAERVFRVANILPDQGESTGLEKELIFLFKTMPLDEQKRLLRHVRATIAILEQDGEISSER